MFGRIKKYAKFLEFAVEKLPAILESFEAEEDVSDSV